jgi:hypothetical protein
LQGEKDKDSEQEPPASPGADHASPLVPLVWFMYLAVHPMQHERSIWRVYQGLIRIVGPHRTAQAQDGNELVDAPLPQIERVQASQQQRKARRPKRKLIIDEETQIPSYAVPAVSLLSLWPMYCVRFG